jgi:3-phenylpropionate/cinnamic acid dioxygenase small subunit
MQALDTPTYQEIQLFYARQMRALDEGEISAWAGTFEPDGVFDANGLPEPVRGRELIESSARKAWEKQEADGIQRRHWIGMLDVERRADGTLLARHYALVLTTRRGGDAAMPTSMSCTCDDVLVRDGDRLLVRLRTVRRDDRPAVRAA